jgi:hypothetical protein
MRCRNWYKIHQIFATAYQSLTCTQIPTVHATVPCHNFVPELDDSMNVRTSLLQPTKNHKGIDLFFGQCIQTLRFNSPFQKFQIFYYSRFFYHLQLYAEMYKFTTHFVFQIAAKNITIEVFVHRDTLRLWKCPYVRIHRCINTEPKHEIPNVPEIQNH